MKSLLQINITANWGSTGKIAEAIGVAAMNAGWKSYIAYGRWSNPSNSNLIKIGGPLDKYFHYAEQRICDNEGLCSRNATRKLVKQIEVIKPDVVHLHNIHDHFLNYQILFEYLNQSNIKIVWTFHDCWAFTGHCFHFVTKECMKWKSECFQCPMKKVLPKTCLDNSCNNFKLKKSLFGSCENLTIVSVSNWMASFVQQSFLKDKRVEIIKNGIDLTVFKPIEEKVDDSTFRVLAVSNVWNQDKGLHDIYQLRTLLPKNYLITIVGLTEKQLKELPEGIKGIKRTQNIQELVKLYSQADVLINPTYADTFPTVNLEALACGTPVITYKTGGSPEAVDEKTGIVVEQGNIISFVDAIQKICSFEKKQMVRVCRERAELEFDKDTCYNKYVELYNNLISK